MNKTKAIDYIKKYTMILMLILITAFRVEDQRCNSVTYERK